MHEAIPFVVLALGVIVIAAFFVKESKRRGTQKGVDRFNKLLPEGYNFKYYNDFTGYAINAKERKVLLYSGEGRIYAKYDISDIRNVERIWETPGKSVLVGKATIASTIQNSHMNVKQREAAYENSGLYVFVKDVNRPRWHVKFENEQDLLKSYEIFCQAIEGNLS